MLCADGLADAALRYREPMLVQLDADESPPESRGGYPRRSAAHKWIEDNIISGAVEPQKILGQGDGLFGRMLVRARNDLPNPAVWADDIFDSLCLIEPATSAAAFLAD